VSCSFVEPVQDVTTDRASQPTLGSIPPPAVAARKKRVDPWVARVDAASRALEAQIRPAQSAGASSRPTATQAAPMSTPASTKETSALRSTPTPEVAEKSVLKSTTVVPHSSTCRGSL
jgi:hypothetical protein